MQTDSTATVERQELTQWADTFAEDVLTDVVFFDTDKPADSLTGLPPVKAIAKQRKATQGSRKAQRKAEEQQQTQQTAATTDKGTAHWERQEEQTQKQKPAAVIVEAWFVGLLSVVGIMLMVFAVAYIRYKFFNNSK